MFNVQVCLCVCVFFIFYLFSFCFSRIGKKIKCKIWILNMNTCMEMETHKIYTLFRILFLFFPPVIHLLHLRTHTHNFNYNFFVLIFNFFRVLFIHSFIHFWFLEFSLNFLLYIVVIYLFIEMNHHVSWMCLIIIIVIIIISLFYINKINQSILKWKKYDDDDDDESSIIS